MKKKSNAKWTEEDIKKKMESGTLPSRQNMLFDSVSDVQTNDLSHDAEYTRLVELVENGYAFFFPINVPSLKNSQEIQQMYTGKSDCCKADYIKLGNRQYQCTACNKPCKLGTRHLLRMSERAQEYINIVAPLFESKYKQFEKIIKEVGFPLHIGMYFIRESNHEFDFDNAITMICDVIKKRIIPDDSMRFFYGYPLGWHHDKNNPGVILTFVKKPIYDYHQINYVKEEIIIPDI